MAKRLHRRSSSTPQQSGCMGGLLQQVFDSYQHLHVPKMILDRKNRDDTGTNTRHKTISLPSDKGHENTDSGANFSMEDKIHLEKVSGKSNIGMQNHEEMSKKPTKKHRHIPARMKRTISIHHLKCKEDGFPELSSADTNTINEIGTSGELIQKNHEASSESVHGKCEVVAGPIVEMSNKDDHQLDSFSSILANKQSLLQQKPNEAKAYTEDTKNGIEVNRAKGFLDALELINMNREIFLKIIQDPDYISQKYIKELQISAADPIPTNSISSLGPQLPDRGVCSSEQKNISSETESFVKEEMRSQTELYCSNKGIEMNIVHPESKRFDNSASGTYELGKKYGSAAANRFKDVKRRIKDIIKENENDGHRNRISMDGILHTVPYGQKTNKHLTREGSLSNKYGRTNSSGDWSFSKSTKYSSPRFTKSHTFIESMDSYTSLIDSNLGREPKKNGSDRLKLVQEKNPLLARNPTRTRENIRSLPDFDAYFSGRDVQCETPDKSLTRPPSQINSFSRTTSIDFDELKSDIYFEGSYELKPVNKISTADGGIKSLDIMEIESQQYMTQNDSGHASKVSNQYVTTVEDKYDVSYDSPEEVMIHDNLHDMKQAESSTAFVPNSFFQEDLSPPNASVSEVNEDSPGHPENCAMTNTTYTEEAMSTIINKDGAEFNYVCDILNKSGLVGKEFLERWYLPDLPLDPSLFEELEESTCDPDMGSYDININLDHLLLFDLINEVLLEKYNACFALHPWLSCSNSQNSIPMGSRVLEEVWTTISWHLSFQPLLDSTMEDIVSRDFPKNDKWMHLNYEIDDVCMELEGMIFDDVLDKAILEILYDFYDLDYEGYFF